MHELNERLAWWTEARFGMFIHWGIYSVPAGFWKGQPIPGLGEWIMHNGRIPLEEYAPLAQQFNPVKFNAREWVGLAKAAGMKYLVITSKHHDGFAMFKSSNPYNIVDATPYGRDVMADLAEACAEAGIRLCFYYSQDQDWAAPGASGHWEEMQDKGWWSHKPDPERFARYLEEKVKPQLRELLTNYGPIGLIWFDTPVAITKEQSEMLRDFVHALQPDCLVSGRVGHDVGDYGSLDDNQIPCGPVEGAWETPATLNDTWGFKSDDHNWKSLRDVLYLLVDLTSKGVNYLLNVGPTSEGLIPQPSVDLLLGIGKWMAVNSEAIYGTQPNPYPYEFDWGRITAKGDRLYLLVMGWAPELQLVGLRNNVRRAYLLADPSLEASVSQSHDTAADQHLLTLGLPAQGPDPLVSVVVLELEGAPDVDTSPLQQPDGKISLPVYMGELQPAGPESGLSLSRAKVAQGWKSLEDRVSWRMKVRQPGTFEVRAIVSSPYHGGQTARGHEVEVTVAGQAVRGVLNLDEKVDSPRARYFPEYATALGMVTLDAAGTYDLSVQATYLVPEAGEGLTLAGVELRPVR
ncbi:MAG: alpha-L-fucosidase [Armatimonadetes bacterium]|nr:alpha-L-fucosidase [Armatimonadota bacterium]